MRTEILNSRRKLAFSWDPQNRKYEFYNQSLKNDVASGILIPPYARADFQNREVVYLPKDNQAELDLFIDVFLNYYFRYDLVKDGFKLRQVD